MQYMLYTTYVVYTYVVVYCYTAFLATVLIICVSVFLTGYAARMVRLSVKNRYRYSKHVNHRVFPAELPHYIPNTRDYAT